LRETENVVPLASGQFPIGKMPMPRGNLFIFDEPTTGLHFDDVAMLLRLFQRLVARGHSIVVIEHNLEVIKCADWIVDLGPEAGDAGGDVIAVGTPEQIAKIDGSHTGDSCEMRS
jgi:Excinuclease ATPase subunit